MESRGIYLSMDEVDLLRDALSYCRSSRDGFTTESTASITRLEHRLECIALDTPFWSATR